ncbi:MAG: DUF362 domain-containing protein [Deltaproteobacteria bacterium]|nr:MAG: DUF362 domain-containing protein [Deltaproteobacteria bacterium]
MNQRAQQHTTNRRDFLLRLLKGGIFIGAACSLSYWLYDAAGPGVVREVKDLVTLPDFSLPSLKGKMSIVTGGDRTEAIRRALDTMGGIETFIKKGDRVLLKVNAAFATPPILSATTNPQLVAEVAHLCYKAGASSVVVTDNPINDPASCFALTGIEEAATSAGAKVLVPKESFFQPTTVSAGVLIQNWPILWEPFQKINKVIGMAPVKDHHRSGASMIMKNWYGLLGGRRNIFHQDINTIITELAMMVKPTLVILDGTTAMMTNGPTGGSLSDLKQTNTMIVSTDQVAADAFGATLLGKTVADLLYIPRAESAGLGTADYEALSPVRVNVS